MGHKTHPIGFRLGVVKEWQARWFAQKGIEYQRTLLEDLRLRRAVQRRYREAAISRVEIERSTQEVTVSVWTARPGIVIGRQGQRVEEMRQSLEALTDRKVRISVQEIRQAEIREAEIRPGEIRPGEVHSGEVRPGEVRAGEIRPGAVRPGEVGPG